MGNIVKVESSDQLSKTLLSWYESHKAPLSSKVIQIYIGEDSSYMYHSYMEININRWTFPCFIFLGSVSIVIHEDVPKDYDTSSAYTYNDYMREMRVHESFVHVRTAFGAGTFEQTLREAGYTLVADAIDTTGVSGCYIIQPTKKWYTRIELKSLPRDFLSVVDFTDLFL